MKIKNRDVQIKYVQTDKQLNLKAIAEVIAQQIRKELTK